MTTRTSPIFVKTPQPDTEERLVLVPPGAVVREYESQAGPRFDLLGCVARDATPADLVRAVDADAHDQLARHYRETIGKLQAATTRAEKAESDRNELVAILVELFGWEDTSFLHAILHVENAVLNQRADLAVEKARAEKAEAERNKARRDALNDHVMLSMRAEKAEREREEAKELARVLEVERDTARAELARLTAPGEGEPTVSWFYDTYCARPESTQQEDCADAYRLGVAHERARQATDPRMKGRTLGVMLDECEDLEALEQDAYVAPKSREGLSLARKIAKLYAAARHAEARQQPAKDRATDEARPLREVSAEMEAMRTTHDERERVYVGAIASDEELVTVYRRAAEPLGDEHGVSLRDLVRRCQARGVLAVAARVRQERCLVAQAVAAGADIHVTEVFGNRWRVVVTNRDANSKMDPCLAAADVPAALARLLGEVSRG